MLTSNMHRAVNPFCERFGLRLPILLAPMAGACPTSLSIAVANAGSMGACAALLFGPNEMKKWAQEFRAGSTGPFQINLWIPEPAPTRDAVHEAEVRRFLEQWGPPVPQEAGDIKSAAFARAEPAGELIERIWNEAQSLLR